jgi:hypothetical protein
VPHVRQRGADDGALHHLVSGGNALCAGSSHVEDDGGLLGVEVSVECWVVMVWIRLAQDYCTDLDF